MKPILTLMVLGGLTLSSVAQIAPCGASLPFTTYEAEAPTNRTTGKVVKMTGQPTRIITPEMEASGRAFVELAKTGQYLDFPNVQAANTIVLRHCIPDARAGGGQTASLNLYINNRFRQSLILSSRYNWLYGEAGQNDPAAGAPHAFWDETRYFIAGGVKKGDTLRLQKDTANTAAYYRVDSIDLESAPPPLPPPPAGTYLSVASYGATGHDDTDVTAAIQACIAAAKEQKKIVWLPAGTYHQSAKFDLDGVTVRGAGMWYTSIIGGVDEKDFDGALGFKLRGDGPAVSDLFIESTVHTTRDMPGGKPFTSDFDNCRNWHVENVWITHTNVGFWMCGVRGGTVRGCRVRFTYADGININRGSSGNLVENNHVRGTGDDGIALLSQQKHTPKPSSNNTVRANTVLAVWFGHNLDVAGGAGHVIENNLLADNANTGCLTIHLPDVYPMYPQTSAIFHHNTILRGGGILGGVRRGAIWISPGSVSISDVRFEDNTIIDPVFYGIHLAGGKSQKISFERNVIVQPGMYAIFIEPQVKGAGTFIRNTVSRVGEHGLQIKSAGTSTQNTVSHVGTGASQFVNKAGQDYKVSLSGNSWK